MKNMYVQKEISNSDVITMYRSIKEIEGQHGLKLSPKIIQILSRNKKEFEVVASEFDKLNSDLFNKHAQEVLVPSGKEGVPPRKERSVPEEKRPELEDILKKFLTENSTVWVYRVTIDQMENGGADSISMNNGLLLLYQNIVEDDEIKPGAQNEHPNNE